MTYQFEANATHDEIAKHINKALGKRLNGEQVAMVLEGAKDFRATAKERAEAAKQAKKQAKIAALKAQLAELTGGETTEAEAETTATVTPIKKAAATPPAKKAAAPKGAAKKTAQAEKDKAKRAPKVEDDEADVRLTPPGAEPIVVDVEEDGFETVGGAQTDDDSEWDDAFGDDADTDSDAEDF